MKAPKILSIILLSAAFLLTCETNPLTGETTLALMSDSELFAMSFQEYNDFLKEHPPVSKSDKKYGKDAQKVEEIGIKIKNCRGKMV